MFCPSCGKPVDANVKFCSNCGAQISEQYGAVPPPPPGVYPRTGRLIRPRHPRLIAGVCAAFALEYGWDLSLVRVVTVIAACCSVGIVALAYFVAWLIIPEAPYELPYTTGTTPGNPAP